MAKYAHDFSSFPFVIGVVVLFLLWVKENIPTAVDVRWFKEGGGMVGHKHPPAWKFNAGQKLLFWLVVLGTIGVAASGCFLLFPFYLTNIFGMQIAQVIHALIAVAFVARDHRASLYRHIGDGGRLRRDGQRRGRSQLGEAAPPALGGTGARPRPQRDAAGGREDNAGRIVRPQVQR